jgi:hypothetical protein
MLGAVAAFDLERAKREEEAEKQRDTSIIDALSFMESRVNRNDYAIIIGNSEYGHDLIPNVTPAHKDVEAFKKYALEGLGIPPENIIVLKDATKTEMENWLGKKEDYQGLLYNRLFGQGRLGKIYFYYSGHGVPSVNDRNAYLVPVDANPEVYNISGYPLATLYENISLLPASERHVVIEACFSGGSSSGDLVKNASSGFLSLNEGEIPLNINAATATSSGEIASWDEGNGNSIFTKYYLLGVSGRADANGDRKVSSNELAAFVTSNVRTDARKIYGRNQNPVFKENVR